MTIKELCRDDLIGRFASHTFTETVIENTTLVEFKDGGSVVVAEATYPEVDDAYLNIRTQMIDARALYKLTTAEIDALTNSLDGTKALDSTRGLEVACVLGVWQASADTENTLDFTGTSLTLLDSHSGVRIRCDNASDITITLDTGLKSGFKCELEQVGVGQVQVSANGTTINGKNGDTKTSVQHGVVKLLQDGTTNVFSFSGDTAS